MRNPSVGEGLDPPAYAEKLFFIRVTLCDIMKENE
jgi:hypothetical protein